MVAWEAAKAHVEGGTSIAGFFVKKLTGLKATLTISAGLIVQ